LLSNPESQLSQSSSKKSRRRRKICMRCNSVIPVSGSLFQTLGTDYVQVCTSVLEDTRAGYISNCCGENSISLLVCLKSKTQSMFHLNLLSIDSLLTFQFKIKPLL
jgi:hypothetical protein